MLKTTVRKKLIGTGIEVNEQFGPDLRLLKNKITELRARGMSYQAIADLFIHWKVQTRTREGKWYGKTVRELAG